MHTASPLPSAPPKRESDVIEPAVNGTKAVLEACHKHRVKRLIITSSALTIFDPERATTQHTFTEKDWLEPTKSTPAYEKSKLYAEKFAWEYVEKLPQDEKFELVTVNPGFIVGPMLINSPFSSADVIYKVMMGKYPGVPRVCIPIVDVRDVARAHLRALSSPPNKRYAVVSETIPFMNVGQMLHNTYGTQGYTKIVRKEINPFAFKVAAVFLKEV